MRNEAVSQFVGRRLRWRRRIMDLTQTDVAARCGLTFQQIQKYEAGLVDLSIGRLVALAAALETPLSEILQGLPDGLEEDRSWRARRARPTDGVDLSS